MQELQDKPKERAAGYPVFVDLRGCLVVVIGGGAVAQRKIATLLEYGPRIKVVSPQISDNIRKLADEGALAWEEREYREGDLKGARLVFCACGIAEVDRRVHAEAQRLGCMVNVVDVPELCDFIVPSIVRRGLLTIASSTAGASCTEAGNIRRQLEDEFDESWEPYLDLMSKVRDLVKQHFAAGLEERTPIFKAAASAGFRQRLAAGEDLTAQQAFAESVASTGKELPAGWANEEAR